MTVWISVLTTSDQLVGVCNQSVVPIFAEDGRLGGNVNLSSKGIVWLDQMCNRSASCG
jgi:hypothetical protein